MRARGRPRLAVWLALAMAGVAACEGPDLGVPWDFERMLEQPRDEAYGTSPLFADGRSMRTPPAGTQPWDPAGAEAPPGAGEAAGLGPVPPVDRALLARGRERFGIFCAPCHGPQGRAGTPVAARMDLRPPPSLHEARLRALEPARLRRVIEHGYGLMPAYGDLLGSDDAWAVAYYVKALQLAGNAPLASLPEDLRRRAEAALPPEEPP